MSVQKLFNSSDGKQACVLLFSASRGAAAWNCNKNVCSGTLQGHRWNVFINLTLNNFCPLSLASVSSYFPEVSWVQILSCTPRHCEEVKCVRSWRLVGAEFGLTARKPQLRLERLSRGFSSCGDANCWCVAAVAAQVSVSGCSVECDAPCSWGDSGEDKRVGAGGGGVGVASPSGLSHTAAHSQREGLYMYGPFIELKCLHCLNYSLFCPTHTNSTSNVRRKKKWKNTRSHLRSKNFNHGAEMASSAFIFVELALHHVVQRPSCGY